MNKDAKTIIWLVWAAGILSHPLIALFVLPAVVAVTRKHRHPVAVLALNILFGWTPAWLLVLLYATEHPDAPFQMLRRRQLRHVTFPPVKVNVVETKSKNNKTIII